MAKYLKTSDLRRYVNESHQKGEATTELLQAVRLICEHLHPRYRHTGLSVEDMQQECCLTVLNCWKKLDAAKYVFSYITSIVLNEYRHTLRARGKEQQKIKALETKLRLSTSD